MEPLSLQRLTDPLLVLRLAIEQEEASAARAGNFAPAGAGFAGHLIPLVDPGISDPGRQPALGNPGLMEIIAHGVDLTPEQVIAQVDRGVLDDMEGIDDAGAVALTAALLLTENLCRVPGPSREEEHQPAFELGKYLPRKNDRLNRDAAGAELDEIQPTKTGRELVLLADRHLE